MKLLGFCLMFVAAVITVTQIVTLGPQMPDPVISKFGPDGAPRGWMSKSNFLWLQGLMQFGMAALFIAIAEFSHAIPDWAFNMPNKEYWLHPNRREETLRYNGGILMIIGGITGLFLAAIWQQVYRANLAGGQPLDQGPFAFMLSAFLIAIGISIAFPLIKFGRIPKDDEPNSKSKTSPTN